MSGLIWFLSAKAGYSSHAGLRHQSYLRLGKGRPGKLARPKSGEEVAKKEPTSNQGAACCLEELAEEVQWTPKVGILERSICLQNNIHEMKRAESQGLVVANVMLRQIPALVAAVVLRPGLCDVRYLKLSPTLPWSVTWLRPSLPRCRLPQLPLQCRLWIMMIGQCFCS